MRQKRRGCFTVTLIVLAVIVLLSAAALSRIDFGYHRSVPAPEAALRDSIVATAVDWLGCGESDSSHIPIVDIYNSHEPLARGYAVQYDDEWCSTYASAIAIQCGLTDIIPTECGCERQIGLWQNLGCWKEQDFHIPQPGDLIYYDWEDSGKGDCRGWSDHVGMVVGIKWPFIKVIEGNKDDMVTYRFLHINDETIRGFGIPDYRSIIQ